MENTFSTPVEMLAHWAQQRPDRLAFSYLDQGETEVDRMTFAEMHQQACKIGAYLQSFSQAGERAMLIFPPGLEFVRTMYGCLYAGVIPIPTNPPTLTRSAQRLYTIIKDSQASMVITTPELRMLFEQYSVAFPDLQPLRWLDTSMFSSGPDASAWQRPTLTPERLAFIQYTSGSTNLPKGVEISYRNLSYNRHVINTARQGERSEASIFLHWVPLFHDMGLIGGVFQAVYEGVPSLLMSPIAFMQQPARWLKAISKYRVTASGGPNFAYELCLSKIHPQDCAGLDLSCWKVAYNSAEPVRAETQDRFAEKFAPYGFDPHAFMPCYGLAEATLLISARKGDPRTATLPVERAALEQGKVVTGEIAAANRQELVNCGAPLLELKAVIVNPTTQQRCTPDEVGEIWVAGDNISTAYWNNPEATNQTLQTRLPDTGEGPFLRTGDLGILHNGDLYITGRHKDLIIVRGRNYYPQDIELTVQKSHPAMRPGGGAAFAIQIEGNEHLVVVQEVRDRSNDGQGWDEALKKIRADIAREHGIRAHSLILIERGSISKTSSGKIMRSECRSLFEKGELDIVAEWRAPTP